MSLSFVHVASAYTCSFHQLKGSRTGMHRSLNFAHSTFHSVWLFFPSMAVEELGR